MWHSIEKESTMKTLYRTPKPLTGLLHVFLPEGKVFQAFIHCHLSQKCISLKFCKLHAQNANTFGLKGSPNNLKQQSESTIVPRTDLLFFLHLLNSRVCSMQYAEGIHHHTKVPDHSKCRVCVCCREQSSQKVVFYKKIVLSFGMRRAKGNKKGA